VDTAWVLATVDAGVALSTCGKAGYGDGHVPGRDHLSPVAMRRQGGADPLPAGRVRIDDDEARHWH
jgi:hypothetical protein